MSGAERYELPYEQPHLALVDRGTFEAAQHRLAANKANAKRNAKTNYLLRGLAKCGACGYSFHGTKRGTRIDYQCGKRRSRGYMPAEYLCSHPLINGLRLDDAVWSAVVNQILQHDRLQVGQSADEVKRQQDRDAAELAELAAQERKLEAEADRLLSLSTDPDLLEVAQAIGAAKLKEKAEALRKSREHVACSSF